MMGGSDEMEELEEAYRVQGPLFREMAGAKGWDPQGCAFPPLAQFGQNWIARGAERDDVGLKGYDTTLIWTPMANMSGRKPVEGKPLCVRNSHPPPHRTLAFPLLQ